MLHTRLRGMRVANTLQQCSRDALRTPEDVTFRCLQLARRPDCAALLRQVGTCMQLVFVMMATSPCMSPGLSWSMLTKLK